jgi:dsDNA-specific endonuclease/ATPase MutS2
MINLKDLWIGDKVRVAKINKTGTFEGINEGLAKIKIEGKIFFFPAMDIEEFIEAESMPIITFENEPTLNKGTKITKTKPKTEIDLHIEKLNPGFTSTLAENVLDHQLKACEDFIREAIDNKLYKCTIIHGKGEGKLKELVHSMLDAYIEVKMKILTNRDGATEVWLSYI